MAKEEQTVWICQRCGNGRAGFAIPLDDEGQPKEFNGNRYCCECYRDIILEEMLEIMRKWWLMQSLA